MTDLADRYDLYRCTIPDTDGEVLITVYPDGTATAAFRRPTDPWTRWGPPVPMEHLEAEPVGRERSFLETMLSLACRYCGARPGQWCRSKSGRRSVSLHSTRWYDAKEVQ